MKLKISKWVIHEKAIIKILLVCFLIGIPFGVKIAAKELYREASFMLFFTSYALIIPKLLKNIGDDIERVN